MAYNRVFALLIKLLSEPDTVNGPGILLCAGKRLQHRLEEILLKSVNAAEHKNSRKIRP
jgi:hypothetical protein